MNPEQLNEKIAEWLGYRDIDPRDGMFFSLDCPNFTASQDTHGPIIEKLNSKGYRSTLFVAQRDGSIRCAVYGHPTDILIHSLEYGPTRALAFCLAVEKIIDEEK